MVPLSVPRKCAVLLEPVEDVEPHGARPPLALAEGLFAVQEGGGDVDVVVRTPDLADLEGAAASVLRQHPIYDFQAFCATASRGVARVRIPGCALDAWLAAGLGR